jgi:hypothetical protein
MMVEIMDENHNKEVTQVLLLIIGRLSDSNIEWMLTGSTNLFIQGVKITAKDIDIVSTKDNLFRIEEIFSSYCVKKITYNESEKYRSWFGRLIIDKIQVDLMANLEYRPKKGNWIKSESFQNRIKIIFNKYLISVNPLEYELVFYKEMNRKNDDMKIKMIKELIDKKKNLNQV